MNNYKISFLISTNRPYDLFAKRVVDRLYSNQSIINHEIIICSPDFINDERIIFVNDVIKVNGPQGFNQAAKVATGDYIVILTDDHYPFTNFEEIPKIFNSEYFINKEYKVASCFSSAPCFTGHGDVPKFLMSRFPILTKETLVKLEYFIFHPEFNYKSPAFADHYLSIFLGINDCETIEVPLVLQSFQNEIHEFINNTYENESLIVLQKLVNNYKKGDKYV